MVDCRAKGEQQCCNGWAVNAGLWRSIFALAHDIGLHSISVCKVKAHRNVSQARNCFDRLKIVCNSRCDVLAKLGAKDHPFDGDVYSRLKEQSSDVKQVCKYMSQFVVHCAKQRGKGDRVKYDRVKITADTQDLTELDAQHVHAASLTQVATSAGSLLDRFKAGEVGPKLLDLLSRVRMREQGSFVQSADGG